MPYQRRSPLKALLLTGLKWVSYAALGFVIVGTSLYPRRASGMDVSGVGSAPAMSLSESSEAETSQLAPRAQPTSQFTLIGEEFAHVLERLSKLEEAASFKITKKVRIDDLRDPEAIIVFPATIQYNYELGSLSPLVSSRSLSRTASGTFLRQAPTRLIPSSSMAPRKSSGATSIGPRISQALTTPRAPEILTMSRAVDKRLSAQRSELFGNIELFEQVSEQLDVKVCNQSLPCFTVEAKRAQKELKRGSYYTPAAAERKLANYWTNRLPDFTVPMPELHTLTNNPEELVKYFSPSEPVYVYPLVCKDRILKYLAHKADYRPKDSIFDKTLDERTCVQARAFVDQYAKPTKAYDNRNDKVPEIDLGDGGQKAYINVDGAHRSTAAYASANHADLYMSKDDGPNEKTHPNVGVISPHTGRPFKDSKPLQRYVYIK